MLLLPGSAFDGTLFVCCEEEVLDDSSAVEGAPLCLLMVQVNIEKVQYADFQAEENKAKRYF